MKAARDTARVRHQDVLTTAATSPQRQTGLARERAIGRNLALVAELECHSGRGAAEEIGQMYGLTPSEMRVLHAVVEIGGIRDIAVALTISPTTVKTHLRHIFQKTGTKGQVDLIRLIARGPSSET